MGLSYNHVRISSEPTRSGQPRKQTLPMRAKYDIVACHLMAELAIETYQVIDTSISVHYGPIHPSQVYISESFVRMLGHLDCHSSLLEHIKALAAVR